MEEIIIAEDLTIRCLTLKDYYRHMYNTWGLKKMFLKRTNKGQKTRYPYVLARGWFNRNTNEIILNYTL